ncbi:MAG: phage baseplate assembly protein V [Cyanobacteria bacterium P01_F01_bin.150]
MNGIQRYHGKYRATVINNVDPKSIGRLQVMVPDVSNVALSSWAMPCVPLGGIQMGMYMVPAINAGVWIEFEQGDPDYPIWVGYYWGSTVEVPATAKSVAPGVPVIVMQTPSQNAVVVSDVPVPPMMLLPGAMMVSGTSAITADAQGVTIRAPKITLEAAVIDINGLTSINETALVVTP